MKGSSTVFKKDKVMQYYRARWKKTYNFCVPSIGFTQVQHGRKLRVIKSLTFYERVSYFVEDNLSVVHQAYNAIADKYDSVLSDNEVFFNEININLGG
jgi:hypothetical protein